MANSALLHVEVCYKRTERVTDRESVRQTFVGKSKLALGRRTICVSMLGPDKHGASLVCLLHYRNKEDITDKKKSRRLCPFNLGTCVVHSLSFFHSSPFSFESHTKERCLN